MNIYSVHTSLELKAEGHSKVKTLKRKSYLLGQCYNFLGVECDPWWSLITAGGVTWTSETGIEYLDPLLTPSGADIAEILFYSLLDFCKMGVMIPTRNTGATNEMPSANSSETQETLYSVTQLQLI